MIIIFNGTCLFTSLVLFVLRERSFCWSAKRNALQFKIFSSTTFSVKWKQWVIIWFQYRYLTRKYIYYTKTDDRVLFAKIPNKIFCASKEILGIQNHICMSHIWMTNVVYNSRGKKGFGALADKILQHSDTVLQNGHVDISSFMQSKCYFQVVFSHLFHFFFSAWFLSSAHSLIK